MITLPPSETLGVRSLASFADVAPPTLSFTLPASNASLNTAFPTVRASASDAASGIDTSTFAIANLGASPSCSWNGAATIVTCTPTTALSEGPRTVTATAADNVGFVSNTASRTFTIDTTAPVVSIETPANGLVSNQSNLTLTGSVSEPVISAAFSRTGATTQALAVTNLQFSQPFTLTLQGTNTLTVTAKDSATNQGTKVISVILDTIAPQDVAPHLVNVSDPDANGYVTVTGGAGSVEGGSVVSIYNPSTGETITVTAAADGSFSATIRALSGDDLRIVSRDAATNSSPSLTKTVGGTFVPPDPSTVAVPIDPTVTTDFAAANAFLYYGFDRVQTGADRATLPDRTVAILRGRVLDESNNGLGGVHVRILGHPEWGSTRSRVDGRYEMAVEGGTSRTVVLDKAGYLPVHREASLPWRDFAHVPEAILIPVDSASTTVNLADSTTMTIAQASVVSDSDGTRQAVVLVPAGTTAEMIFADNSSVPVTSGALRVSEHTVGTNGPDRMPGTALPPTSGYTYCASFTLDEAIAAGAARVEFSQPLISYTQNYRNFPIGFRLPAGSYNYLEGRWIAEENGLVIKVLSITNGMVDLDVDGSGFAASQAELDALGITDEERASLATLYGAADELSRVAIPHFSPWDMNAAIGLLTPALDKLPETWRPVDYPTCRSGSIVECENQTLQENVPITGSGAALVYRSDRTLGRVESRRASIEVVGDEVPLGLQRVHVEFLIAGQITRQLFSTPSANLVATYTWDGLDAFGRRPQGEQELTIRVGYDYELTYEDGMANASRIFGGFSSGAIVGFVGGRYETTWVTQKAWLGTWDAERAGLAGLSISSHHAYNPGGRTLYLGDGSRRAVDARERTSRIEADLPGTRNSYGGVALADGSYFVTSPGFLFRVWPDGTVDAVAGILNETGCAGDGGPAADATLSVPIGMALGRDGSVYIADQRANRIRRISPDGTISTVAGSGPCDGSAGSSSGDGGPATSARLYGPTDVAVGPDGSLYIADLYNHRVRRVDSAGIISTLAGTGTFALAAEDVVATTATLYSPSSVSLGPDGSVYIAESAPFNGGRVSRITPQNRLVTFAGNGAGDGTRCEACPATEGAMSPAQVRALDDGRVLIADSWNSWGQFNRIILREVSSGGVIRTIAGCGHDRDDCVFAFTPDAPALDVFAYGGNFAVLPDNTIVMMIGSEGLVRRIAPALPGFSETDLLVASRGGGEVYVFDRYGRHKVTKDALTGALRKEFTYDANGRLATIADTYGNTLTIQRDAFGIPTGITAPGGQVTDVDVTNPGQTGSTLDVTNPEGERHRLTFASQGLLASFTNPRDGVSDFSWDSEGRLSVDADAADGSLTLSRVDGADDAYTVTVTTGENRSTTHFVERLADRSERRTTTRPDGTQTITTFDASRAPSTTFADGSISTSTYNTDPRWGLMAPSVSGSVTTTPAGKSRAYSGSSSVSLSQFADPFSVTSATWNATVNGKTWLTSYDGTTRRFTTTSPEGRSSTQDIDANGRVIRSQMASLAAATTTYDSRGRAETVTQGSGADARTLTLGYNTKNELVSVTDPLTRQTTFAHDLVGRVTQQTLPDTRVIQMQYDAAGNVSSVTPPDRPAHGFEYSPVQLESRYSPPAVTGSGNTVTDYARNKDKQLTLVTRPDAATIVAAYVATNGKLASLSYAGDTITPTYSGTTGKLTALNATTGADLAYTYDGFLALSETWSGPIAGSVSRTFDNDFRVVTESVNAGNTISVAYDDDGLVTQVGALALGRNAANGLLEGTTLSLVATSRTHSTFGEMASESALADGTSVYAVTYERDKLGRITDKTETILGTTAVWSYTYDLTGRLTHVEKDGLQVSAYGYDGNSNRLSHESGSGTVSATYDGQDRLLTYGNASYTYTANGELATKTVGSSVTSYQYDALGNLRHVTLPNGTNIDYVIDVRNRRVGKKVNGVLQQAWLYRDQLEPVAELDGAGNVVSRFVYATKGHSPDYMLRDGRTYRIVTDHLGSPRLVIDVDTGEVVQEMRFDEWGVVTLDTNPGWQPFGFAGGLLDADTGLTRFGARDYAAAEGRWTAKDPLKFGGGDSNLFGYVLSDPINYFDPEGEAAAVAVGAGGAAVAIGAAAAGAGAMWCLTHPELCQEAVQDVVDVCAAGIAAVATQITSFNCSITCTKDGVSTTTIVRVSPPGTCESAARFAEIAQPGASCAGARYIGPVPLPLVPLQ